MNSLLIVGSLIPLARGTPTFAGVEFLSDWTLSPDNLPYITARGFAIFDNQTTTVYGIGGTDCTGCGFIYNLTDESKETFTINSDSQFHNGNSNNAVLINNTEMFAIDYNGRLWQFNIFSRNLSMISTDVINKQEYACLVSNYPQNTHLFTCNGNMEINTTCYKYTIANNSWHQITSVKYVINI